MRVGVTVTFKHSVFSAGSPQMSLTVAEVFSLLGHTVTFIRIPVDDTDPLWWDDNKTIKDTWKSIHYKDYNPNKFDIVFEIEHCLLPADARKGSSPYVLIVRKSPLFHDIEKCITPHNILSRDLNGITESWIFNEIASRDDIEYLELITRKPVRTVPFVWSPLSIEIYNKETSNPIWHTTRALDKPYMLTVCEKNNTSSSSCTIPLMAIRQIIDAETHSLNKTIAVFNGTIIKEAKFFTENVVQPCMQGTNGYQLAMEGRCRLIDLCKQVNTVMIAHSRFISLRTLYLDCLWVGIPLVHNTQLLCELGEYVAEGFYNNNDILGASKAFTRIVEAAKKYTPENLVVLRKKILTRFGLLSETIKTEWNAAMLSAIHEKKALDLSSKLTESPTLPASTPPSTLTVSSPLELPNIIRVGFCDMWHEFNPSYNFFTLLLTNHLNAITSPAKIVGVDVNSYVVGSEEIDLLIFGPFGQRWSKVNKSIPKVHYTGENTGPVRRDDVQLNLGFEHNTDKYLRFPLWLLEIDWFSADPEKIVNPKPVPLESCINVPSTLLDAKDKFCSFIVSNPKQPVRNNAFKVLTKYKQVDSAGRLFNNVGDILAAGPGGGGGELKKHQFLKSYKFSIAYENTMSPGYTTEKYLHAKAAGCVPIYWGDSGNADFDMEGCIDARGLTEDALIETVRKVDTDNELWRKKASIPLLDGVRFQKAVALLRECSTRILSLIKVESKVESNTESKVESKVESKTDSNTESNTESKVEVEAKPQAKLTYQSKINIDEYDIINNTHDTYFITACNRNFLSSLHTHWLPCIDRYRSVSKKIHAIVGLFDCKPSDEIKIRANYQWVTIVNLPNDPLPNFPDSWNAQHFLWKLWMYKHCVSNPSLQGSLCIYIDTACIVSRWPTVYARNAIENGISVLNDHTQINRHWCHSVFNSKLHVTEEELASNQTVGGICAFIAGNAKAVEYFTKAYELGTDRQIIVGDKWTGVGSDGKPYGHRHDQSILSVLSLRMNLHRTPLYSVYNDVSLRNTFLQKKAFYVYRNLYREHIQVVEGIDDAWLINLDRRPDRLAEFNSKHPDLEHRVIRIPAIDGKDLKLTPAIARLFASMPLQTWMKGAMGCAMSHMIPWLHLSNEKDIESYLVVEDDAVLHPTWKKVWSDAHNSNCIPTDYDIIYLGGILPPNKEVFETQALTKINDYIGKIKPNSFFGQNPPNTSFHVTTCAYVLSKRGAEKLIKLLNQRGCFAHLDHFMCSPVDLLNIYFMHPLLAHAKQDSDPVYAKSQFNNLTAIEGYDSDIRDGSVFTKEEAEAVFDANVQLDIITAITDARNPADKAVSKRRVLGAEGTAETAWIKTVMLDGADLIYEPITNSLYDSLPDDTPIVVYTLGDNNLQLIKMLRKWSSAGKKFYLLHLGDAALLDPIDVYSLPGCLAVVRNYIHPGLHPSPHLLSVPLGYQYKCDTAVDTERDLVWSFLGTNWHKRKELLTPFLEMPSKHHVLFVEDWFSPSKLNASDMYSYMKRSMFVPCPSGENYETYRIYEALEAGAMPVLVRDSKEFTDFITSFLPLKVFDSWDDAALITFSMSNNKTKLNDYRTNVLNAWVKYKKQITSNVKTLFHL